MNQTQQDPENRTEAPPPPGPGVSRDEALDLSRLRRSSTDRYVAGVAGGLGRHLNIDPVILRVLFVVLTLVGGGGLLAYLALWLLVARDDRPTAPLQLGEQTRQVVLLIVLALVGLALLGSGIGYHDGGWIAAVLVVGLLCWLVVGGNNRQGVPGGKAGQDITGGTGPGGSGTFGPGGSGSAALHAPSADGAPAPGGVPGGQDSRPWVPPYVPPATPRRTGPILFWPTLATAVLILGVLGLVQYAGVHLDPGVYPAAVLAVTALGLLVGAWYGRPGGLPLLGILATGALLVSPVVSYAADIQHDGVHDLRIAPTSTAQLRPDYRLGSGDSRLDLTGMSPRDLAGRSLGVHGRLGRIVITVPRGLVVRTHAGVRYLGAVRVDGQVRDGEGPRLDTTGGVGVTPPLTINADLEVGDIEVSHR